MSIQHVINESNIGTVNMNNVFLDIFNFNGNKTLLLYPHDAEKYKNDCKHYKIFYPIAAVLNSDIIPFNVKLITNDSNYNEYINNHSKDDFNVFMSNIHITTNDEEYLTIDEMQVNNVNMLLFKLYLKKETNNFHLKIQQELDDYINKYMNK